MVSARRGWGTQRANPGAPAAQHLCPSTLRGTCTQGANPGAHAARCLCSSTLRGPCTQWATTGPRIRSVEPPVLRRTVERNGGPGKGRNPRQNRGWAEPRTAARSQCSVKHPGHCAGAHATRVNHSQQGTRPADARPAEWGSVCGGRPRQCWRSRAPGPHAHGNTERQVVDGLRTEVCGQQKQSNDPPQQPAQTQYANYWAPLTQTAHPAASTTAPAHQPLGSANAETTPAGAPAAAADDRKQRPDATCEGKNG